MQNMINNVFYYNNLCRFVSENECNGISIPEIQKLCLFVCENETKWPHQYLSRLFKRSITNLARTIEITPQRQILVHFNRKKLGDRVLGITPLKTVTLAVDLRTGNIFASIGQAQISLSWNLEVAVLQQLQGLPHILQFNSLSYYLGKLRNGSEFELPKQRLTVEYCNGGDLQPWLEQKRLNPRQKQKVFKDVIRAVAALHRWNLLHGDLKPENIFLKQIGSHLKAILGDLATIRHLVMPLGPQTYGGTGRYCSPEYAVLLLKLRREKISDEEYVLVNTLARDIWALGMTLFWLLDEETYFQSAHWFFLEPLRTLQALANLQKDPIEKPKDENSPMHLIWGFLRINPAERLSVVDAEYKLSQIDWDTFFKK